MRLSVITVTWNSKNFILKQIESVRKAVHFLQLEHFVIDNASTDGTADLVREKFPQVNLIANTENKGFAAANNQGFARSSGEYVLFLNPDMRLAPGSLDTLVEWMEAHLEIGIASPKLVDENGNINLNAGPRRFPRLWEQCAIILKLPHLFPSLLNGYHLKGFDFDKEQVVDSVRGSFMLVRRALLEEIGFAFDPRYFIWFEDVDLCRECIKHEWKVVYTPMVIAVDYVGQSFKKRTTWWKQKQFIRSMFIYFRKWGILNKKIKN